MGDEVDKEEMKRCLKDANIFEDNMSEDLMTSFYKAIKNSESSLKEETKKKEDPIEKSLNESANELLEAINNSKAVAPLNETELRLSEEEDLLQISLTDSPTMELKNTNKIVKDEENNNSLEDNTNDRPTHKDVVVDIKKIQIGFNDMPASVHMCSLDVVTHELKYVNILNSTGFITAPSQVRRKMLYNYHKADAELRSHYASLSLNMVPLREPINLIDPDLYENPAVASLKSEDYQYQDTYISRSGRMTKRKVYAENDDSLGDTPSLKKNKTDSEWLSKNSKERNLKASAKKLDFDNKLDNKQVEKKDKFDDLKDKTEVPAIPKPRTYQRKITNEEIMARSSLFKDSFTPKKSRTESIIMAGKLEAEKNKEKEDAMNKFTKSLDDDSDSVPEDFQTVTEESTGDKSYKRRVTPPWPSSIKGPLNWQKKSNLVIVPSNNTPVNSAVNNNEIKVSSDENGVTKRNSPLRKIPDTRAVPSTSRVNKSANMTPCPLCSVPFPQKKIEEHAATCGEDVFARPSETKLSRISCEVCDQIIPLTTDYEVHVKQCIAKQSGL